MNQEMIEKLENMVACGKITLEQKEELLQALQEPSRNDVVVKNSEPPTWIGDAELKVLLTYEDLVVHGKSDITQVEIVEGSDLIEMTKTGTDILIQSKKENGGFVGQLIKRHSFIKHKNGFTIQDNRQSGEVVINVPLSMNIRLKTVSGDMQLRNLEGRLQAKSVSGDISLKTHNNQGSLHSISGDIHIEGMKGPLESTSKSGDIHITQSDIQGEAKTYSGDIRIEESKIASMDISVFSGDIEMDQTTLNQGVACKTFSGDIHLALKNANGYVKGVTASGEMKVITADQTKFNLTNQEYGDPSSPLQIQIKTLSGDGKISFTKLE